MKTNKIGIPIFHDDYVHDIFVNNNTIAIFKFKYNLYVKGRYINTNKYGINLRIKIKTK
jgi:hypothetical protein